MPSALAMALARPVCTWCGLSMRYLHTSNRWECDHRGGSPPSKGTAPLMEMVTGEYLAKQWRGR